MNTSKQLKKLLDSSGEQEITINREIVNKLNREYEDLKIQLKGTTHCFDEEEEHNKLKEEITNLSKDVDMWNSKYNDMFDENKELKLLFSELKLKYLHETDVLIRQQEEFIKYLEDKIYTIETTYSQINGNYGLMNEKLEVLKDVLNKYKEIVNGTEQN